MKYGPNSEQVQAYLQQVAELDADDWTLLAQLMKDSPAATERVSTAIEAARSRATKHGLLNDVAAADREAREAMEVTLDASPGLQALLDRAIRQVGPDDATLTVALRGPGMTALRTAATSGASLLVLRPLLTDDELHEVWPMHIIDLRSLPRHVYSPPMGAVG